MALIFRVLDGRRHLGLIAASEGYRRLKAAQRQRDGIAATHLLIETTRPARIVAYCQLSIAQLYLHQWREKDRARLSVHPVPVLRIDRIAVARPEKGKGHGRLLLGHAVNVALSLRGPLGVRAVIVDAHSASLAAFYGSFGFHPVANEATTRYLPMGFNDSRLVPD